MIAVERIPETSKREFFSAMAREHHRDLLIFARALVHNEDAAYDIVQESFVAAWGAMARFDVSKDFGAWMRGVVRNKWREYLRKNNKEVLVEDDILELMESQMSDWQVARNDGGPSIFIRLDHCLKKLPEAMAQVVQSFYIDRYSTDEVADSVGVTGATVRKRLERARTHLKSCLDNLTKPNE